MDKKKFYIGLIAFFIISLIIFEIYFLICLKFSKTPNLVEWEKDCFDVKNRIAIEKVSSKIVLMGGSNVLFGISAEQIEKETGLPTVNYGVEVGLEDYGFEKAKEFLNPKDIIVFSPEYENYYFNNKILFQTQTEKERYILTYDKEYFNRLPSMSKINMIVCNGPSLIDNILSQYQKIKILYPVEDFNSYGDETNYVTWENATFKKTYPVIDFPSNFEKKFPNYDWEKSFLDFDRWCNERNITLFISFAPTIALKEYENAKEYKKFETIKRFFEKNNLTCLGEPSDYFYDSSLFYDTPHHLNQEGKNIRTKFIINQLFDKALINKNEKK